MWEYYLAMSEAAFRTDDITIFQLQLARRRTNAPMTRGYIETREAANGPSLALQPIMK